MTETDWQETAARMRREDKATTAEIAEAVGRSESQVRKVLAKANAERAINGAPKQTVDDLTADHRPLSDYQTNSFSGAIPGQTTVDDHLPPEDDPEYEPPAREMDGGEVVSVSEVMVSGSTQLGLFDAGGRSPESASVRLAGGKIAIVHGEAFEKGTTIHFSGTAVITAVKQQDKRDAKTGQVVGCEQQHTALITDLTVN